MASTRGRLAAAAAAALAGVLALSACGSSDEGQALTSGLTVHTDDGMNGAVLTDQYVIPDTTLTATDGAPYSLTADTTKPVTQMSGQFV